MWGEGGLEPRLGSRVQLLGRLRRPVSQCIPLNDLVGGQGSRCTDVKLFQE